MLSWLPENISTFGADIDSVYALIYWCVTPWFLLTEGLILVAMLWFRRRPGRRAQYLRGDTWGQLAWILVPTAIVLGLDFWIDLRSAPVWANVKQHVPAANAFQVKVLAKQFNWQFTYPGPDGAFGTADDKHLDNELHVPIDRDVVFTLESSDVVHSFFVPVLRLKQDVLPGRTIRGWFNATQAGRFELPCAELCGFGHYTMRGFLFVHTPEEFDQWAQEQWPPAPAAAPGGRS
jgi:cytochrome c oxidase subunit II